MSSMYLTKYTAVFDWHQMPQEHRPDSTGEQFLIKSRKFKPASVRSIFEQAQNLVEFWLAVTKGWKMKSFEFLTHFQRRRTTFSNFLCMLVNSRRRMEETFDCTVKDLWKKIRLHYFPLIAKKARRAKLDWKLPDPAKSEMTWIFCKHTWGHVTLYSGSHKLFSDCLCFKWARSQGIEKKPRRSD